MIHRCLRDCVDDLERHGHLIRIKNEVEPCLEMAAIQRRVFKAGGPAILYERVKGSPFRAVSNLFGTEERLRFIFRHTLKNVEELIRLKLDPFDAVKHFYRYLYLPFAAKNALPKKALPGFNGFEETSIDQLPQILSWPKDGGPFITLPQALSVDPESGNIQKANLGMYRIQLSGNQYKQNEEIGLHYQIHRGIGVHHTKSIERGEELPVSIFIGGPPAHTIAAVMPLPEDITELAFGGALAGRRFRYAKTGDHFISTDADFCITGYIDSDRLLPEGPFGDHLGYYSLTHDFPVMKVTHVYHRKDAIWPFTVVGRPPQEDSVLGKFIHDLTGELIPAEIPGVKTVHAVDAAGVHPLLLAIGSERYVPYQEREPMEILTQANAILGFGQLSLAKYLWIAAGEDDAKLDIHHTRMFFQHMLSRVRWESDLHFHTSTTIDTLDYSGVKLNHGSKLVIAAAGKPVRKLAREIPVSLKLPRKFRNAKMIMPGIMVIEGDPFISYPDAVTEISELTSIISNQKSDGIALIVMVDVTSFTGAHFDNFIWVTFTRSNPSHDVYGVDSFIENKHWGCRGPLIIDARIKPHHAPPLEEDPVVEKKVNAMGAKGGRLHGII